MGAPHDLHPAAGSAAHTADGGATPGGGGDDNDEARRGDAGGGASAARRCDSLSGQQRRSLLDMSFLDPTSRCRRRRERGAPAAEQQPRVVLGHERRGREPDLDRRCIISGGDDSSWLVKRGNPDVSYVSSD